MAMRPRKIIAIDVDSSFIRMLEVRGNRVIRWYQIDAPGGAGAKADGTSARLNIETLLQDLVRIAGKRRGEILVSLSALYSISRVIRLPGSPLHQTVRSMPATLKALLPSDDLVAQWQIMQVDADAQHILVVASPRSLVDDHVAAFHAAGVRPSLMETRGMALASAIRTDQAVIVNVEKSIVDLVLTNMGIPYVTRTVEMPRDLVAEDVTDLVLGETVRAISYHNERYPDQAVTGNTPLFLTGTLSPSPNFHARLARDAGLTATEFTSSFEAPRHFPIHLYASTLGLATRQLGEDLTRGKDMRRINISLLPQNMSRWRITRQMGVGLLILAIGLAGTAHAYGQVDDVAREKSTLERHVQQIDHQITLRQEEIRRLSKLEAKTQNFEELIQSRERVTKAVALVAGTRIDGITIDKVDVTPREIQFTAQADTVEAAMDYVDVLRAAGWTVTYNRPAPEISAKGNPTLE